MDLSDPGSTREETSAATLRTGPPTVRTERRDDPARPWGEAPAALATPPAPPPPRRRLLVRWARRLALVVAALAGTMLGLMVLFRFVDPPGSPLMLSERWGGASLDHRWVALESMSPRLVRAVVGSEDARFCAHHGIDFRQLKSAIEATRNGNPRGASTITMQVVKNLFLWPSRSYVRKAIELPLALMLELVWPKRRILEVYLNIAEWGPGIYGAEAAAQNAFGKPASRLTDAESVRLAVSLPNPIERDAGDPDATVERLAARLERRLRPVQLDCLQP